MTQNYCC